MLRKQGSEHSFTDNYKLHDKLPNMWAVLFDKGYYGAIKIVRSINPTKKPANVVLVKDFVAENRNICSDRIIAENVSGRLCSLWTLISAKYKWKEYYYDSFLRFCVALTNFHIERHPLRHNDGSFYRKLKNKVYIIGVENVQKRHIT